MDTQYIPHATTYINQHRFNDDPPIVSDPVHNEQQALQAKEDKLLKEQREQAAYLKRAKALAPKNDEELKDAMSPISDVLKELRNKHSQA